jgi:hypothetical protein
MDMLHRVLPSHTTRLCLTLWFYGDADDADSNADRRVESEVDTIDGRFSGPLRVLLEPDFRHLFARYVYAREWAASIEESHEQSDARDAALDTHWSDVEQISAAACQRLQASGFGAHDLEHVCAQLPLPPAAAAGHVEYFSGSIG